MRIALTIEFFDPAKGGGETYARNFARALAAAGHDVHVYANAFGAPLPGLTYHPVPMPPLRFCRRYAFATRVERLLRRDTYDIVHGFGKSVYMDVYRPGGGVHRAWMEHELRATAPGLPRRLARLRQRTSLDHRLVLRLERRQFGGGPEGPHIIAVSRLVHDEIRRWYGTPEERLSVVYNGVDLDRHHPRNRERFRDETRRRLSLAPDELALLFVGHNFKRKGLRAAIRAVALLQERAASMNPPRRFRLLVLGGDRPSRYAALAERLGCADLVHYLGAAAEAERYYAAADVLFFPSYYDPCANVCLEALANGLPVVTSTTNGSGELLTPGREGFVVDCDDIVGLADAVAHFSDDDARREAGCAARALAETRPIERNLREVLEVYEKVLARKGGKAR